MPPQMQTYTRQYIFNDSDIMGIYGRNPFADAHTRLMNNQIARLSSRRLPAERCAVETYTYTYYWYWHGNSPTASLPHNFIYEFPITHADGRL